MFSLGQMFSSHVVFFRVQMSLIKVDWLSIGKHQDLMMYGSAWLQLGKKRKKKTKRSKRNRHPTGVAFPNRL